MTAALQDVHVGQPSPPRLHPTRWASALLILLGVDLGAVAALALARLPVDAAAPGGLALWGGRASGLLAQVLILGLVLLAARIPVLERAVGQDRLLRWHRWLAPTAVVALIAHPLLLAAGYAGGWWTSLISLGSTTADALVGTGLFLLAAAMSVRLVRRRLPYEGWHLLHITTYAAVVLVFLHQLTAGTAVLSNALLRGWWLAQLVVVLAAAAAFRVALPVWRSARHGVRVATVHHEGHDVVTVTLHGRDLHRLGAAGGQFLSWRFLDRSHWWRAHPFSLSAAPRPGTLRFTARQVGDGTRLLDNLRPGTRVLVEGPYGVLTADARSTDRLLLIGAGLGIAPLRALLESLPEHADVDVLQRASSRADAVLHDELQALAQRRPRTRIELLIGPRGATRDLDRPLGMASLQRVCPDVARREVFLCGPPALTTDLLHTLNRLGVPRTRLHSESFEL
ncbi:MAG: oxidoreductase [Frankiales bacterium]|nr:oxidoreductase [Frankiales bacterium]